MHQIDYEWELAAQRRSSTLFVARFASAAVEACMNRRAGPFSPAPLWWLIVGLLAVACGRGAPEAPPPPEVTVAPVIEREINDWDEFTGRMQAVETVEIRPRVSGYIQTVAFDEGKEVRRGDVLFIIDPRPYQAELARASAELER